LSTLFLNFPRERLNKQNALPKWVGETSQTRITCLVVVAVSASNGRENASRLHIQPSHLYTDGTLGEASSIVFPRPLPFVIDLGRSKGRNGGHMTE